MLKRILKKLISGQHLSQEEIYDAIETIINFDQVTDAQIGAFLACLGSRPATADELTGAAMALREHMTTLDTQNIFSGEVIVDTCGTGGSGLNAFNTSTVAAFIAAAAGLKVAKHGNRAATGKCGSADLLEALGVNISLTAEQSLNCLYQTNFCFLFAPLHHGATKRVALIRRELGFRTIFNFLGPLANPAGASYQLLGVSDKAMVPIIAEALKRLKTRHAMVVCGDDGLDEISTCAPTFVAEVNDGLITSYNLVPEDFGFARRSNSQVEGDEPKITAEIVKSLLHGKDDPRRELVLFNAGAVLYLGNKASNIKDGIKEAEELLDTGRALKVFEEVKTFSNQWQ